MGDNLNWKSFENDPFYSQVLTYWYDEWNSISEEVKNGMIGINIVNIRVVLLDIINEYELNQFESENNRKVYIKLIETLISKKYISIFREELFILKEKLEKKEKTAVYVISKELSSLISKQSFALVLFDELFSILEKKLFQKIDRLKVKELTKEIIVDLVTSGMNIEDVKKIVSEVFESYFIQEEKIHIIYRGIPGNLGTDEEKKDFIDHLSIQDRLDFFRKKLLSDEKDYIFIYPIWGMITHPIKSNDISIFGCQLYSPDVEKMLGEDVHFDETFDTSPIEERSKEIDPKDRYKYRSKCNAKILVRATSLNSAAKAAESKFLNLLSLLNLYFAQKYHEFFWDGQYIGEKVGEDYSSFGTLFGSRDDKQVRRNLSRNDPKFLSDKKYEDIKRVSQIIEELEKRDLFYEANTILSVIDIMSQAQWQNEENKLLNYWIAVESLANISKKDEESKFDFVKEIISNIYFLWEQYRPLQDLFRLTEIYSRGFYEKDDTINIPNDFLESVGIYKARSEDSVVSLVNFYNQMEELKKYTSKESFLDEIEDTINFYKDNKEALKRLREKRSQVKLTVDYIYKCRNQIVHNGYVDKNLVPYLVNFSEAYASSLFNRILNVYSDGNFNLQNYFIKEIYDGHLLERKLSNSIPYNLGLSE
ncbi:hypothetical protein [Bacillus sp. B-jedd]|uniref:hypothetical protein n=1 Tax=Bacillus sp. B-jedd TaxID=1476857 RepID=UPI00051556AD|nr:hypothetical protein [Bacillus sp. B-jedd]CEG26351.1 hypothetical protein BN1002_01196 [Bacillus sp. B-jedd]